MRTVLIVLFDGVQSLDVTGPLEVFNAANRWCAGREPAAPGYAITTASLGGAAVRTTSGLGLLPDADLAAVRDAPDLLVVPGGEGARRRDPDLVGWLRAHARAATTLTSVCTGAFLLAEAGLLTGRAVTTHWERCDDLAAQYPDITVDPEPIFIKDGNLATSAGVTSGIDLALALIEEDLGRDWPWPSPGTSSSSCAARAASRSSAPSSRRRSRAASRSARYSSGSPSTRRGTCPSRPSPLRASLSPRQFARAFAAEVGLTPGRYVDNVRIEAARRCLEDTADGIEEAARACGYGTPEAMRRAFIRTLGVSPAEYRRRFRATPAQPARTTAGNSCRSSSRSLTASPPSTRSAPTRCSSTCRGRRSSSPRRSGRGRQRRDGDLHLAGEASFADVPHPDVIVVPGGSGEADQLSPGPLQDWLLEADKTSTWTTSVCTGALILARAGLLAGRAATTNWQALEELERLGVKVLRERYVFDGKYVTAAGVSAGIDMALALAARIAGDDVREAIQLGIEYDPRPPFNAGSPATAPPRSWPPCAREPLPAA